MSAFRNVMRLSLRTSLRAVLGTGFGGVAVNPFEDYPANGFAPDVVADFVNGVYKRSSDTSAVAFGDLFTFGRASAATYVDSSGVLQTASSGNPRAGHHVWNGSAWVNVGLRLESATATNLLTYSEDFTNAAWIKNSCTISSNAVAAPDGTTTMDRIVSAAATAFTALEVYFTTTAGNYVQSWFVKADDATKVQLLWNTGFSSQYANFNLSTKTVAAGTYLNAGIEDLGNGFLRIFLASPLAATTSRAYIALIDSDTEARAGSFEGDGTLGLYAWGAQVEAGAVPSSYIKTAGSTATRAAETLTIAAANMPYSATAISFAMKGALNYADNNQNSEAMFYQWNLVEYIRSYLATNGAYAGGFGFQQYSVSGGGLTGSSQAVPGTFTPGLNKSFGVASRHGSTFLQGAANGISLTASATPTAMPNISSANFQIGSTFNGTIDMFRAWSADIAQAGIEEASS